MPIVTFFYWIDGNRLIKIPSININKHVNGTQNHSHCDNNRLHQKLRMILSSRSQCRLLPSQPVSIPTHSFCVLTIFITNYYHCCNVWRNAIVKVGRTRMNFSYYPFPTSSIFGWGEKLTREWKSVSDKYIHWNHNLWSIYR